MSTLPTRLEAVLARVREAEIRYGRTPGSVSLLAVSKTRPIDDIVTLLECGQFDFGENYLSEAAPKIEAITDPRAVWHFIGPIQANKSRGIAQRFSWVHGIDRLKVARRLSEQRPPEFAPLRVCVQVNVSAEPSKHGVAPEQASELAHAIAGLPGLQLRGLMAVPAPSTDFEAQRAPFRRLNALLDTLCAEGLALDTLSMGMSADLEAAIAEGATMVRIGTAIFGPRA